MTSDIDQRLKEIINRLLNGRRVSETELNDIFKRNMEEYVPLFRFAYGEIWRYINDYDIFEKDFEYKNMKDKSLNYILRKIEEKDYDAHLGTFGKILNKYVGIFGYNIKE